MVGRFFLNKKRPVQNKYENKMRDINPQNIEIYLSSGSEKSSDINAAPIKSIANNEITPSNA